MPGPTEGTKIAKHRPCPQGAYNPTVLGSLEGCMYIRELGSHRSLLSLEWVKQAALCFHLYGVASLGEQRNEIAGRGQGEGQGTS